MQWAVNQAVDYIHPRLVGELDSSSIDNICFRARHAWKSAKDEAAAIGTIAHNWIEAHLKGENPPMPEHPKARNSCEGALAWLESKGWETVSVEDVIFSPTHRYAGKGDWKARINGVLSMADWKTSKALYSTYRYQLAAYVKAIEETTGEHLEDRWLVRIDKETGEFEELHIPRSDLEADFAVFLGALTIHRREAELRRQSARAA